MLFDIESTHEYWMHYALSLAKHARDEGEVPIGAVLIYDNQVIGEGWNCSVGKYDPTAHAEIIALRQGGLALQNYRLLKTTMYVTLEPCMMCYGAMIHSRIDSLIYGAKSKKNSAIESLTKIFNYPVINHQVKITGMVLASECSELLSNFFQIWRHKKNNKSKS